MLDFKNPKAKGRTNIELREQFILADGVSQSMAAFTPRRSTPNAAQNSADRMSPYMSTGQGPIMKVRERSVRSIPMSRNSRSVSASTPDSLSDNEGNHGPSLSGRYTPRKVGTTTTTTTASRTGYTPVGSRAGSKPNSRPLSRQGSKPPSRHGSNLSLDSADGTHTPSRIPQRKISNVSMGSVTSTPKPARFVLNSSLTSNGAKPRKTTSGSASPAPTRRNIGGGITSTTPGTHRASDATFSSTQHSRASRGTTPVGKREPFRL